MGNAVGAGVEIVKKGLSLRSEIVLARSDCMLETAGLKSGADSQQHPAIKGIFQHRQWFPNLNSA